MGHVSEPTIHAWMTLLLTRALQSGHILFTSSPLLLITVLTLENRALGMRYSPIVESTWMKEAC
jgi:hypothetical protein